MTIDGKLNNQRVYFSTVKHQATSLEIVVKGHKEIENKKLTVHFKIRSSQHPKHLHPVHFAIKRIVLQKSATMVPMSLTDQNALSNTRQQLKHKRQNQGNSSQQDQFQTLKTLQTRKATTPMGRIHISETISNFFSTHNSISISKIFENRRSISFLASTNRKKPIFIETIITI